MTQDEKRALEIYIALIIQSIRKENNKALEQLRAFFYAFSYADNYDPELLYKTCIENIEIIEKIPSHGEILMASKVTTGPFNFKFSTFKPYYRRKLTNMQLRQQNFSIEKIILLPRITKRNFHNHLLTFLENFVIMSKNIPLKEKLYAKRKNV